MASGVCHHGEMTYENISAWWEKCFTKLMFNLIGEDGGFYLCIEIAAVFFQVYDCVHSSYKDFLVCAQLYWSYKWEKFFQLNM